MAANEKLNLTMLCDFYELTMSYGYFEKGYKDRITYFDVFYFYLTLAIIFQKPNSLIICLYLNSLIICLYLCIFLAII